VEKTGQTFSAELMTQKLPFPQYVPAKENSFSPILSSCSLYLRELFNGTNDLKKEILRDSSFAAFCPVLLH